MIKINLLPPRLAEEKKIHQLMVVFGLAIVLVLGGCTAYVMKLKSDIRAVEKQVADAEILATQTKTWNDQKAAIETEVANVAVKVKFFKDAAVFNTRYPELYEALAKFTYSTIVYSKVTPGTMAEGSGQLQIEAYAPTISDAGKYLLNMYRADHIFQTVAISGIPGYPAGSGGQGGMSGSGMAMSGGLGASMMPASMPSPMMAPGGYGGLGAITAGVDRAEQQKSGITIGVTCNIKPEIAAKLLAPKAPGDNSTSTGMSP